MFPLVASLAFRNLFRNLRRTVITSVAVVVGVGAFIAGWGLIDGLDENFIRAQEEVVSGHVLLRPDGYPTDGINLPLSDARPLEPALLERLGDERVKAWTARLWFHATMVSGPDALRVKCIGYDPEHDPVVFPRDGWDVNGRWPAGPGEIALGENLADLVKLAPGARAVLESRTRPGAINALDYEVVGIVRTRNPATDSTGVWMPLATADDLVRPDGARTHLAVLLEDGRGAAEEATLWLSVGGWRGTSATWEAKDLIAINVFRRRAISLVAFILLAIAGTGIANTVIMAAYERIREIGTLRALGLTPGGVRAMFLLEGAVMGVLAGAFGAMLGSAVVAYFNVHGIDVSGLSRAAGGEVSFSTLIYTRFSWGPVLFAVGFGAVVSLVASVWPAHHAATLNPADAVRAD